MAPLLDILIPTYNRPAALAVTISCLIGQTMRDFRVIIADQTENAHAQEVGEVQAVANVLGALGIPVTFLKNLPRLGMAHQRQYLLDQSSARYALFLDDDVILESRVIENMTHEIQKQECGFVGCALIGLTHIGDIRPHEQQIEFWHDRVQPEVVRPGEPAWERHKIHNAANLYHVAQQLGLSLDHPLPYKVAWVGGCVLYDTGKLLQVGGFSFWKDLPSNHAGEDVLAQLRVMEQYGGCGLIPSGAYHQQIPTTIPKRLVDAPRYLK